MSSARGNTVARPRRRSVLITTAILTVLSAAPGVAVAAPPDHAPHAPEHLTVGDQSRPLEVEGTPRFGWQPHTVGSGHSVFTPVG
ncbi:hypothetical protein [Streptomyces brasiliensis]|uniref:Uncharacterized protein n=1 Tax=Streptomyces brasiliensis TaxID=1954 RepID=A0A917NYA5_9ACTN|nr:hypothetical protein [Streptomyces brasiliensis]GGJ40322.1 hypothetical protein GCM10010121_059220 [Streptomyces brasiliensis]